MTRKLALGIAVISLMMVAGIGSSPASAWAKSGQKVDCDKVMAEVQAGKKTKDIEKDLSISSSSVYRCKKKAAGTASKTATTKVTSSAASPAAASSPSH